MSPSKLIGRFPWATSPLISNAPMLGIATPLMTAEVTKAGGLGKIYLKTVAGNFWVI